MYMPAMEIPGFRTQKAIERGVEKNLLFTTWGGIGDQICAEPTLRFALDTFTGCRVSLATELPQLYKHLKFDKVIDLKHEKYNPDDYLVFQTITNPESLSWHFMSHMVTNCVDFPSLCAIRCQLPISYKRVRLEYDSVDLKSKVIDAREIQNGILVHAGRHWESKTFPRDWWEAVCSEMINLDLVPILIGKDVDFNVGTVEMDTKGCVDLRNKCSLNETIWLVQNSKVLVCSDSAPLHMAAPADTWVGCIATVKHPDYIFHWRKGGWSWRMENLGVGGYWDHIDYCPNKENKLEVDKCPEALLRTWLPAPEKVAQWALSKKNS